MLAVLEGKLHWAPIGPNPQRVLDIGTGTGIWAIDFGKAHESNTRSGYSALTVTFHSGYLSFCNGNVNPFF
jgi:hypothetical protein